jgi:nucleoid DNA-binding protein
MASSDSKSRSDLVSAVAEQHGMSQAQVEQVVRSYEAQITSALLGGGEVRLAGFGSFKTSQRAARTARNPQTGAPIKVAARKVARFQPAKALKDLLAAGKSGAKKAAAKSGATKSAAKGGAAKSAAKSGAKKAGRK